MTTVVVAGSTFTWGIGLFSQADVRLLQANPTIAAGDFQRSINGGAFANLDNLPTVTPAGGTRVEITLSVAETAAAGVSGKIWIRWIDAAGAEWCDSWICFPVYATDSGSLASTIVQMLMNQSSVASAVRAQDLTLYRGDTWSQTITGLGDLTAATDIWFGIKADPDDSDNEAIVLISETVGLERINGAAALVPANGSITVVGLATAGVIQIDLDEVETAKLVPDKRFWDCQHLIAGTVTTPRAGRISITADIVRATS